MCRCEYLVKCFSVFRAMSLRLSCKSTSSSPLCLFKPLESQRRRLRAWFNSFYRKEGDWSWQWWGWKWEVWWGWWVCWTQMKCCFIGESCLGQDLGEEYRNVFVWGIFWINLKISVRNERLFFTPPPHKKRKKYKNCQYIFLNLPNPPLLVSVSPNGPTAQGGSWLVSN